MESLDWHKIWELHAPHFSGGKSKIPLKCGRQLELLPGPGFGDLSHPTTSMCLSFLEELGPVKSGIDIGTGSGILAIAMALMGSESVTAYEIDRDAINHAEQNIRLNQVAEKVTLNPSLPPTKVDLIVINMISSEQAQALASLPFLNRYTHTRIVSGILVEQEDLYLRSHSHGQLLERRVKEKWVSYRFLYPMIK